MGLVNPIKADKKLKAIKIQLQTTVHNKITTMVLKATTLLTTGMMAMIRSNSSSNTLTTSQSKPTSSIRPTLTWRQPSSNKPSQRQAKATRLSRISSRQGEALL